jgi:predicted transcriptional regulator
MNNVVSIMTNNKGRKWIVLSFLLVFSAILYIGYSQKQFKFALTKIFQDKQTHDIILIQNLITNHIDEASQNLQYVADMIATSGGDLNVTQKTLDMVSMSHADDFLSLSLIDIDGKVIASSGLSSEITNLFEYAVIEQSGIIRFDGRLVEIVS